MIVYVYVFIKQNRCFGLVLVSLSFKLLCTCLHILFYFISVLVFICILFVNKLSNTIVRQIIFSNELAGIVRTNWLSTSELTPLCRALNSLLINIVNVFWFVLSTFRFLLLMCTSVSRNK